MDILHKRDDCAAFVIQKNSSALKTNLDEDWLYSILFGTTKKKYIIWPLMMIITWVWY